MTVFGDLEAESFKFSDGIFALCSPSYSVFREHPAFEARYETALKKMTTCMVLFAMSTNAKPYGRGWSDTSHNA